MRTKRDYSFGVIPLLKEGEGYTVFLIHQYGHNGDIYWTFPKGHPEEGETGEQTALRELQEETGILIEKLEGEKQYTHSYTFDIDDLCINKTVVFYVGYASSSSYTLQEDEVKEAGWYSFAEALQKLTYEPSKEILKQVRYDLGL